jgi:hypothetical protein
MFGVTRIPPEYRRALSEFDSVCHDGRNRSSLRSLVSALIHSHNDYSRLLGPIAVNGGGDQR